MVEIVFGCDDVSWDILWNKVGVYCDWWIYSNSCVIVVYGNVVYYFDVVCDIGYVSVVSDLVCSKVYGFYVWSIEMVDC